MFDMRDGWGFGVGMMGWPWLLLAAALLLAVAALIKYLFFTGPRK